MTAVLYQFVVDVRTAATAFWRLLAAQRAKWGCVCNDG